MIKKIFIVGIVASGKTTLAKRLSEVLKIPFYEGDCIVYEEKTEGRVKRTKDEIRNEIYDIDKRGQWIIEGTYRESYKELLDMADKIIFLDTPICKRKYRIVLRFIKQKLGIEKSHYKPTIKMLKAMFKWTKDFEDNREEFEKILHKYDEKLLVIHNPKELRKLN